MQNKLPLSEFEIKDAASALDFVRQFRNSMVPAQYRLKFSFATSTQGKKGSVVSLTIAMFHSAVDIHVEPLKGAETVTSKGSYVRLLDGLQDLYRTWEDYFVGQNRYQVEAGASRDLLKLLKSKQLEFIEAWLPENVELFVRVLAVLIVAEPIRCNVNLPLGVMALHLIKHQVKTSDNLFKDDGFWPAAHGGSKNEFILVEDHLENGTPLSGTAKSTFEMMHSVLGVYLASALNTTQKTLHLGEIGKPEQLTLLCQQTLQRKVLDHIKTRASDKYVLGAELNNAVQVPL